MRRGGPLIEKCERGLGKEQIGTPKRGWEGGTGAVFQVREDWASYHKKEEGE